MPLSEKKTRHCCRCFLLRNTTLFNEYLFALVTCKFIVFPPPQKQNTRVTGAVRRFYKQLLQAARKAFLLPLYAYVVYK